MDKLKSIPPDHLLLMARDGIFDEARNSSTMHVIKVLEVAAKGSEEGAWLLDKLRSMGDVHGFGRMRFLVEIMSTEDSPRAKYYRGRALRKISDDDDGFELVRQSAEAGFAPAMSWLGGVDHGKWFCKSAELKDPDGLYFLACDSEEEKAFGMHCCAAALGNYNSMHLLVRLFSKQLSQVEAATFEGRQVLYGGWGIHIVPFICDAERRLEKKVADGNDLDILYALGRELEGYDQFWDHGNVPHERYLRCIDVYLTVMHRARQAALQTVTGLGRFVGRDVAKLIGKMVYDTRQSDSYAWWWHPATATKRKRISLH